MMLLVAGIVLLVSGIVGMILQIQNMREKLDLTKVTGIAHLLISGKREPKKPENISPTVSGL